MTAKEIARHQNYNQDTSARENISELTAEEEKPGD